MLCCIKFVLNSKPITPSPQDPSEHHFLLSGLTFISPELNVSSVPCNRPKRFELVIAHSQLF